MQKWSLSKRMFLVSILWISLSVMVVISAPVESGKGQAISSARQADPMAKDSSGVLQRFMSELLDAVKANDTSREQELIRGLALPTDTSWFAGHFDKKTADLLRSAYQESMKDFEATTRRLYEADIQRGPINIHVNRYADPKTAPAPFPSLLRSMDTPAPLYEVSLSGERPSFQVVVSANGGPSRIVAGDLHGYFIDTPDGFRYIPSSVLEIAVQERAQRNYEVLSRDADGRPDVVRMGSGALAGMILDRAYPTYPESARAKHIGGEVIVSARIGKDGRVREVTAKSGPQELWKPAVDAMKKWRFKPIRIDEYPVQVEADFAFNMHPSPN